VWVGIVGESEEVAVKQFPLHYSDYYYNEKDIYSLPFMDHPALLAYFGTTHSFTSVYIQPYHFLNGL
jgi:bone morphogenetic protein receptor type-2